MKTKTKQGLLVSLFGILMLGLVTPGLAQRNAKNPYSSRANVNQNKTEFRKEKRKNYKRKNHSKRNLNYSSSWGSHHFHSRFNQNRVNVNYRPIIAQRSRIIRFVSPSALRLRLNNQEFFLDCGIFYTPTHKGYKSTLAPIGARTNRMPHRARFINTRYESLFVVDNVYFRPIVNRRGYEIYEVVGYV